MELDRRTQSQGTCAPFKGRLFWNQEPGNVMRLKYPPLPVVPASYGAPTIVVVPHFERVEVVVCATWSHPTKDMHKHNAFGRIRFIAW
jgi:hypothetical protein